MSRILRSFALLTVIAGGLAMAAPAQASQYHSCHAPQYTWKTVVVYETVRKPYSYYVTRYHECGTPYRAAVTGWKTYRVPVKKYVKVAY